MLSPARITYLRVFSIAFIVAGYGLLSGSCSGEDVRQQALDARAELVTEISAVSGAQLRQSLLAATNDFNLARWYQAQTQENNRWLSTDQALDHFSTNAHLLEYHQLREQSGYNLHDQQRLARWCKKHDLPAQARAHWLIVLQFDPQSSAALRELKLTWHDGVLMTESEAELYLRQLRSQETEKRKWQAEVKRLRKQLEQGEPREQLAARHELRAINEPNAVPALVEAFAEPAATEEKTLDRRSELISLLANIGSPEAIDSLVYVALHAQASPLRYAAIELLKSKPLEDYVPALLTQLQLPIESSVSINTLGRRVVSSHSYSQEQPDGSVREQQSHRARYVPGWHYLPVQQYTVGKYHAARTIPGRTYLTPKIPGHGRGWNGPLSGCGGGPSYGWNYLRTVRLPDRHIPAHFDLHPAGVGSVEDPVYLARHEGIVQDMQTQAIQSQDDVQQHNELIVTQNQRVAEVLQEVTGEQLRAFPKSWWNWWSNYLAAHPGVASSGSRQQWNAMLLNQQRRGLARGTWVWTDQGKQHVEDVLPGDFVLSQDPDTGEVAWRVVLAISSPSTMEVSQVRLGEQELFCSPSHVLWAAGLGWQRVSHLEQRSLLHGLRQEMRLKSVDQGFEIDCYDLIVEDFHAFFVGEQPVLVHDGAPIGPAPAALPGFSPAAVAEAVRLVAN